MLNANFYCGNADIIYFVLKSVTEIMYVISNVLESLLNIYGQFHTAIWFKFSGKY